MRGFSGASELADERIALVLDPGALIEEASMSGSRDRGGRFLAPTDQRTAGRDEGGKAHGGCLPSDAARPPAPL